MVNLSETENTTDELSDIEKINSLNNLSATFRATDLVKAIKLSGEAALLADKISYKEGLAASYLNTGICYRLLFHNEKAEKYFHSALEIYCETKDLFGQARVYNSLSHIYSNTGNNKQALAYLEKGLAIAESINDTKLKFTILSNIGGIYNDIGDIASSLENLLKCLDVYNQNNIEVSEVLLNNLGGLYYGIGDIETALSYFKQCLEKTEKKGNIIAKSYMLLNIGGIYSDMKKYDEALNYINKSIELFSDTGHKRGVIKALSFLSEAYLRLGNLDKALELAYEVKIHEDGLDNTSGLIESNLNIGSILLKMNKTDEAENLYSKSLQLARSSGSRNEEKKILYSLAELYFNNNNYDETFKYLGKALTLAEEENAVKDVFDIYDIYYRSYKATGEYPKALDYHEKMFKLENEIRRMEAEKRLKALTIENKFKIAENERIAALKNKEIYRLKNVQLNLLNDKLVKLNEEMSEFLGIAAHDLKNPLAGILSVVSRMKNEPGKYTQEQKDEYFSLILDTVKRMLDIVTKILDINALESGLRDIKIEELKPETIVNAVILDHKQNAQAKNIELIKCLETGLTLRSDRQALRQILDNLVSNAVKFSPENKKIFINIKQCEQKIYLEVQDEGPGLTEKDKTKLFKRFSRLSALPTGGEHTSGLGLSITKKLAEMIKGNILCDSEEGKGAKFIVELPVNN